MHVRAWSVALLPVVILLGCNAEPVAEAAQSAAASSDAAPPDAGKERLVVEGEPIQGGVPRAQVNGRVPHISFPGHKPTTPQDGRFLIAFARKAPARETLVLTFEDGTKV